MSRDQGALHQFQIAWKIWRCQQRGCSYHFI